MSNHKVISTSRSPLRFPLMKREEPYSLYTFAPWPSEPGTPPDELVNALVNGWRPGIFSELPGRFPITDEEIGSEPAKALLMLVQRHYRTGPLTSRQMALVGWVYRYISWEEVVRQLLRSV